MVARYTKSIFKRLGNWVGLQLVQDVPGEIAACEFDCSKERCEGEDLMACERRRRAEAAGGEPAERLVRDQERTARPPRNGQEDVSSPVAAKPAA